MARSTSLVSLDFVRHKAGRLLSASPVVWDVGSSRTRVWSQQRLVFDEASCILIDRAADNPAAFGEAAYRVLGKSGTSLQTIFPFSGGEITDTRWARLWLERVRKQIWPQRKWFFPLSAPPGYLLSTPGLGAAAADSWIETLRIAGLSGTRLLDSPSGITQYLNLEKSRESCFLVDIGASQTVVSIVANGTTVYSKRASVSGITLTANVQEWLAVTKNCQVGWLAAERLKCSAGLVNSVRAAKQAKTIAGRDPLTQMGSTISFAMGDVMPVYAAWAADLATAIKHFIAELPSEIAALFTDSGVWLTGGGSQLMGLDQWLSTELGVTVTVVEEPAFALGKALSQRFARKQ